MQPAKSALRDDAIKATPSHIAVQHSASAGSDTNSDDEDQPLAFLAARQTPYQKPTAENIDAGAPADAR